MTSEKVMLKVKVKSHMVSSQREENLFPQFVGSIINYFSNSTEIAQWAAPNYRSPQEVNLVSLEKHRFTCASVFLPFRT